MKDADTMNTNFIVNESAGEYHARNRSGEFMSSHLLADFRESPAIYYKEMKGEIERQQKKSKKIGNICNISGGFGDSQW